MRILTWHVHAAWSTAFVSGHHEYLVPVLPDRGPYGRGRPRTYPWPETAMEVTPDELRGAEEAGMTPVLVTPGGEEPRWDSLRDWRGLRVASIPEVLDLVA